MTSMPVALEPFEVDHSMPVAAPTHARLRGASLLGRELANVARTRWLIAYGLFFLITADSLLRFGGDGGRALLSLGTVALFVVPLVGLVFGTTYLYDAREYTELLLAQPIARGRLFVALYGGLVLPLSGAFLVGTALPFAWHGAGTRDAVATLAALGAIGVALTLAFVGLAFLIALRCTDKVRGLGIAVGVWLALALLYDGVVLVLIALFADRPVEQGVLGLMLANPIDLARVLLLLRFDAGALQGYTGAVFLHFFGSRVGVFVAGAVLTAWSTVPAWLASRAFRRRDF